MIDLGLGRISSLLTALGNPQNYYKAFHVAGTNGKGSTVSYISSILTAKGLKTGKFTSPHLIHEEDAIQINNVPIDRKNYLEVRNYIEHVNAKANIGATEFEQQTASAFEIFRRLQVEVAVIEVGLGGLTDATNVLAAENVLCSAITKIAFDHEGFLGNTLEAIATHKAGIIKDGVPSVVDGTNEPDALNAVKTAAADHKSELVVEHGLPKDLNVSESDILPGRFQIQNAAVAIRAVRIAYPDISESDIIEGLRSTRWPGRLESRIIKNKQVLIDGAHNPSAAKELAVFVESLRTTPTTSIKWIVAFSKPSDDILPLLVRPQDSVVATSFSAVEGMPWIKAQDPDQIAQVAKSLTNSVEIVSDPRAINFDVPEPVVVCGSLYLLKEFY